MSIFSLQCDCICGCGNPAINRVFNTCINCYTVIASVPYDTEHCKKTINATTRVKRVEECFDTLDGSRFVKYVIDEILGEVDSNGYATKTKLWLAEPNDNASINSESEQLDFGLMNLQYQRTIYQNHTRQGWNFEGWVERQMMKVRDRLNREGLTLVVAKDRNEIQEQKIKQILIENKGRKFDL